MQNDTLKGILLYRTNEIFVCFVVQCTAPLVETSLDT